MGRLLSVAMLALLIISLESCSEDIEVFPLIPESLCFIDNWASSENLEITICQPEGNEIVITSGYDDFKPSWSKTGNMLTFFRLEKSGSGFHDWRTKICVINTDGTGLRELSIGSFPDFNPTWTRDGSNMVLFNRYDRSPTWKNQIFMIAPDEEIGDEQLISHPSNAYYEWAMSALLDGRIFIDRVGENFVQSYLLTPSPGQEGIYEEVTRPTDKLWHKLSVSPSETKVAYMLDNNRNMSTYNDVVLAIADFDVTKKTVTNQEIITESNLNNVYEYPRWTADERFVIYDSNRSGKYQVYAYHLESKKTFRISPDVEKNYQFANCEGLPK